VVGGDGGKEDVWEGRRLVEGGVRGLGREGEGDGEGRNGLQALRLRLEGSGSVGRYPPSATTNKTETQRSFTCQHFFTFSCVACVFTADLRWRRDVGASAPSVPYSNLSC
jgi:hypothetical protein